MKLVTAISKNESESFSLEHESLFRKKKLLYVSLFLLFLFYVKSTINQYEDFFWEAQFLHVEFIKDLVNGVFNPKNFFTTYAEHLFPGYNILLFINYKLFKITSVFELVCSIFASIGIAYILISIFVKEKCHWLVSLITCMVIFSPVQNIMIGMALAAHISTFILTLIIYTVYFSKKNVRLYYLSFLVPIYIILFSGAYSAGFLASLICIILFSNFKQEKGFLIGLCVISFFSYASYFLILQTYGNRINGSTYNYDFMLMIKFCDLMFGSSILGKALYEKFNNLGFYYLSGTYIFCLAIVICFFYKKYCKIQNVDKFFIALFAYSILNVCIVSLARNTNGLEGALGQWYQSHLKFIPIVIIYFLYRIAVVSKVSIFVRQKAALILGFFILLGYSLEYRKSPYIKEWKNSRLQSVPNHLTNPNVYLSNPNSDPLLWNANVIVDGLEFFYKHNIVYFRNNKFFYSPLLTQKIPVGETKDGIFLDILCPYKAKSVQIDFEKIDKHNQSFLPKYTKLYNIDGMQRMNYVFKNEIKVLRIGDSKLTVYNNHTPVEPLFHVHQVSCIL